MNLPLELRRQKILVVDDNEASLYATSRVLRAAGFEILEARSGSEALRACTDDVGLIILDVNLPDMNGFEVCRQLRARSDTAYLPVLHLSAAYTDGSALIHGLQAGADSYLTHPVDPPVLIATVRALLFARQASMVKRAADVRFRSVFELAPSGIALLDAEHRYVDVNPAFCALALRDRLELLGLHARQLIVPDRLMDAEQALQLLESVGRWEGTLPVLRGDGSVAEVEWRMVAEPASGSRLVIATDVTERRRAEAERERLLASERAARAEAERSNRLKDEFLATLSHELRNPLNAILGWASVLRRVQGASGIIEQGLEAIERNSRVQAHLISDLLDFAGIRFGKMRLELVVVDPGLPVKNAVEVVEPQARAKGVELLSVIRDHQARVLADEARLQQIVWNLLSNAIKFTPKGGRVEVTAGVVGGAYEIEVSDTGRGISAEFLPRIFDRFSQQDSGTSKSYSGLGIGLAIVKHLLDMHGGSIDASSPGEGLGACFRVRLPLTQQQMPELPLGTPRALAGLRVLVVEDDADARALIARILTDAGAQVSEASGADEALAHVGEETPDILLSDIGMAKKDGYQLLRALRAGGYGAERLPAVAVTAFSRAQDRQDALAAGFQEHLPKPVSAEALMATILRLTRTQVQPPI